MSDPAERLRRDVSYLGHILGDTLVEQEGAQLLELEEKIRALAKQRRAQPREHEAARIMEATIRALDTASAERVARAFTHYFQLVNLAEQHHRVRRRRSIARAGETQPGSLVREFAALSESKVTREQVEALLARAEVELVFTAHPTEAQRRTVLDKHGHIGQLLERRDLLELTPADRAETDARLREEVATLWQTDEIRQERPRVGDEVKNTLFYLEEVLFPLIPGFYDEIEAAIKLTFGAASRVPSFLRFGSWVGADMDGNPNVTPEVALDTALAHSTRVLALHLAEVGSVGAALSQSTLRVAVSDELLESIARDGEAMPRLLEALGPRTVNEPYRRKLRFIEARLNATRDVLVRLRHPDEPGGPPPDGKRYQSTAEFLEDLAVIERSLAENRGERAGLSRVRALRRRAEVFGFHSAKLDVRVPVEWVRDAAAAALWLPEGAALDATTLRRALTEPRVPARPDLAGMRAMEAVGHMRSRVSKQSGESFILSMAHGREDMLATLVLARIAGLYRPDEGIADVSVVPLFETLDDLSRCADEIDLAVTDPAYQRYLALRGNVQEVMIGYSDSNKDAGILAASFALYRAQRKLVEVGARRGVTIKVFHGRGGSIGRGGGPATRAIEGLPPGSIDGHFKLTEQGEVIGWKYLLPDIAERNLELTAGAVIHASLRSEYPAEAEIAGYEAMFDDVARWSLETYRRLVRDPDFVAYFEGSTPLAEISAMPIGSRPSRRTQAASLKDLRAIPWVFAWTQSRQMVPGWFGAGSALSRLIRTRGLEAVRTMRLRWPFFASVLEGVAVALATADIDIARRYADLVEDKALAARLFIRIALDHARASRAVRAILAQDTLLAHQPTLARSIELRNPYVDPLSFIQIELIRRKREFARRGEPVPRELERAILLTINGIAAGLRNTG